MILDRHPVEGTAALRPLIRGTLRARLAHTPGDLERAQALRARCFGLDLDCDAFDAQCQHILVEDIATDRVICCCRIMPLTGKTLHHSYSAQFYELSRLRAYGGRMAELGRFCIAPGRAGDPDVVRLAWGAITKVVDAGAIDLLFGCSSFAGTKVETYHDAFAILAARHLAPKRWLPRVKAPDVVRFAARLRCPPDMRRAMRRMPPLLRSYLAMGGWVSDHAVVDRHLNTLHVFTGVEIGTIPDARKRLLRALAGA